MKTVSIFLFASLFACSFQGKDDASAKFAIKKKQSHYYAQYTFSHADYDDVEVAVRIEVSAGKPSKMEVKELTPPANSPVEIVVLRASGTAFVGTSSGAVGGEYSVKLVEGACCTAITFVPAADTSATFVGTKSKDLTAAEWEELIAPATDNKKTTPQMVRYFPLQDKNQWILRNRKLFGGKYYKVYTVSQNSPETYILKTQIKHDDRMPDNPWEYTVSKVQNGVRLHKTVFPHGSLGIGTTDFSGTPFLLYEWDVGPDTPPRRAGNRTSFSQNPFRVLGRLFLDISVEEVEVEVQTPIGKFVDCVKIKFHWVLNNTSRLITWTEYEWLAPDFGIVKYQYNESVYELEKVEGPIQARLEQIVSTSRLE